MYTHTYTRARARACAHARTHAPTRARAYIYTRNIFEQEIFFLSKKSYE